MGWGGFLLRVVSTLGFGSKKLGIQITPYQGPTFELKIKPKLEGGFLRVGGVFS